MATLSSPVTLVDGDKFTWDLNYYGGVTSGSSNAFSYGMDTNYDAYSSTVQTELGGRQLVYAPYTKDGVTAVRKVYVSPDDGFIRYLEIFTNTATAARSVSLELKTGANYSYDAMQTSDGDSLVTTTDRWVVQTDDAGTKPAIAHVLHGAGGEGPAAASTTSTYANTFTYDLDLKPGETKIIMHFAAQDATAAQAVADAKNLAALKGTALKGLTDFEIDSIVNFAVGETIKTTYTGTNGADLIVGDRYDETLTGKGGDDLIRGNEGKDKIFGDAGNDIVLGGSGDDRIVAGLGHDIVDGEEGDDLIYGGLQNKPVTTTATKTIPSSGEKLSISLTLPDAANGTTLDASGFVSRNPITSAAFNVAFIIDVSGSTGSSFSGTVSVPDMNGDGTANTVLDAEIAGFEALLKGLTKQIGAENINVAVIPFDSSAKTTFTGSAAKDTDKDKIADVVEALRAFQEGGSTNFESGLQQAIPFFKGQEDGQNIAFFLSDGANNAGGPFLDEVSTLRSASGGKVTIKSYGVGSGASKPQLDLVDDGTTNNSPTIVLDPSLLANTLVDSGIKKTDVDRVEILVNGKVAKTIAGKDLSDTPLGLRFSFNTTLSGLKANDDDVVTARVIAKDPSKTTVSTTQTVEKLLVDGNDRLFGGEGNDTVYGGDGHDTIYGDSGSDELYGDAGNDKLFGGRNADTLSGGDGNDTLDGGLSGDRMVGGKGNDTYVVDRTTDKVIESTGGGTDTVRSSISHTLAANVEKLILTGTAVSGKGNTLANSIVGNSAANSLDGSSGNDIVKGGAGNDVVKGGSGNDKVYGDAGNDRLYGGTGNDQLFGGSGKDVFVFDSQQTPFSLNVDTIMDFNVADDTIWLDDDIFTKAGAVGDLAAGAFTIGTKAKDAGDRVIYDAGTGKLFYDADGTGSSAAVHIATLTKGLKMTAADFDIIA